MNIAILGEGPVCDAALGLFKGPAKWFVHTKHLHDYIERTGIRFDLGISAWNSEILRAPTLALCPWINTHPSLLPYGRGRDPYFWAIWHGEPFGASLHYMDDGIDTGPLITQCGIAVSQWDTSESLRDKAQTQLIQLLKEIALDILAGELPPSTSQSSYIHYPTVTKTREDMLYMREKVANGEVPTKYCDNYGGVAMEFLKANTTSKNPSTTFMDQFGDKYEVSLKVLKL